MGLPLPRVFSMPPGCPFLPTLLEALTAGRIVAGVHDAESLSGATLYLPTRRAARALTALLAEQTGGRAQLLPRIVALGEAGDGLLDAGSEETVLADPESFAPAISLLERRLILTRLVQHWSAHVDRGLVRLAPGIPFMVPASPADAVSLAGGLEALMDSFTTEEVPWDAVAAAVESDFSEYFKITLEFVRIAAENWPSILADRGASDPARRRGAVIAAEAARLHRDQPTAPIIAAGSTGSIPATATLLSAIARLPNGAVVLPGLDTDLDDESWDAIAPTHGTAADRIHGHPQAILHRLLTHDLRIPRAAVRVLGAPSSRTTARGRLLSEAMRPANTTERWADFDPAERIALARRGTDGLAVVEAADERDEALCAALALREALSVPGRIAALVTPDRALAARVTAELARWNILVEDSAGMPLSDSPSGRLARLAAEAVAFDFEPARLLALLAHPDVRLRWPRATLERASAGLEIGTVRGPAPGPGLKGLSTAHAIRRAARRRHDPRPRLRLSKAEWDLAASLLARLTHAFEPFVEARTATALDLVTLAGAHRTVLGRLRDPGPSGEAVAADGAWEALDTLFDDLDLADPGRIDGALSDYPDFFAALARGRILPPPHRQTHRRVKILGLLEARLLSADRVVLGGLDEGVWPPRVETDAFLNRPMRARVGLMPPERRIGQTAHDFAQALGTPDVVITRALKRDGSPMVPSRYLQRLKAFVGADVWSGLIAAGDRWRSYARILETPDPAPQLARPAPKPVAGLMPRSLSVTEIETLIRDPYAIYAKHVLGLDPLEPVGEAPNAASRGTIIHHLLARFVERFPAALPAAQDALDFLLREGAESFADIERLSPRLHAEWWPRFQILADAFIAWETARRPGLAQIHVEIAGKLSLTLSDGRPFDLRARADRIEIGHDGSTTLLDFKTGAPPTARMVYAGFSPQLTLQAAMLMRGGFAAVAQDGDAPALLYIHGSGGRDPLREIVLRKPRPDSPDIGALADEHLARLVDLLSGYAAGEAGFLSRPFPQFAKAASDYDHLARVGEWSATSGAVPEDGP